MIIRKPPTITPRPRKPPFIAPRYDEVFERGVAWLDSLAYTDNWSNYDELSEKGPWTPGMDAPRTKPHPADRQAATEESGATRTEESILAQLALIKQRPGESRKETARLMKMLEAEHAAKAAEEAQQSTKAVPPKPPGRKNDK